MWCKLTVKGLKKYCPCSQNIFFFFKTFKERSLKKFLCSGGLPVNLASLALLLCWHCATTANQHHLMSTVDHSLWSRLLKKTLPKAQQTQGLNASTKVTTFKSYYKLIKKTLPTDTTWCPLRSRLLSKKSFAALFSKSFIGSSWKYVLLI